MANATRPTSLDWARATNAISRLATKLDPAGRRDLNLVIDLIAALVESRVP
jgi:hypothetical protein